MSGCRFMLKLLKLLVTAPGSGASLMAPLEVSAAQVHLTKPKGGLILATSVSMVRTSRQL
jgi:hypothetical protein